jgi:hypothetical protein
LNSIGRINEAGEAVFGTGQALKIDLIESIFLWASVTIISYSMINKA